MNRFVIMMAMMIIDDAKVMLKGQKVHPHTKQAQQRTNEEEEGAEFFVGENLSGSRVEKTKVEREEEGGKEDEPCEAFIAII